jgi:hypothetical protein
VRFLVERIIEPLCASVESDDENKSVAAFQRISPSVSQAMDVGAMGSGGPPMGERRRAKMEKVKSIRCHVCQADPAGRGVEQPMPIFIDGDKYACRAHVSAEKEAQIRKRERELGFECR